MAAVAELSHADILPDALLAPDPVCVTMPLWGICQLEYLLLACKTEATAATISAHYADEISGAVNWFLQTYDHSCQAVPVIVHPSELMDIAASPPSGTRVIAKNQLAALRDACRGVAMSVKDRLSEPAHIRYALTSHGLLGRQVLDQYSISPKLPKPKKRRD